MHTLRYLLAAASLCVLLTACGGPTLNRSGGYVLTYKLAPGEKVDEDIMAAAMQSRLRSLHFNHAVVRAEADGTFTVELPGADLADAEEAQRALAATGHLEMRILARKGVDDAVIDQATAANATGDEPNATFKWVRLDPKRVPPDPQMALRDAAGGAQEALVLIGEDDVRGEDLASVTEGRDESLRPMIQGSLQEPGAFKMGALTSNNIDRHLGIILDDDLLSAPQIRSKISRDLQITGQFTEDEVKLIVAVLKAGSLPARLDRGPVSVVEVQPQ